MQSIWLLTYSYSQQDASIRKAFLLFLKYRPNWETNPGRTIVNREFQPLDYAALRETLHIGKV